MTRRGQARKKIKDEVAYPEFKVSMLARKLQTFEKYSVDDNIIVFETFYTENIFINHGITNLCNINVIFQKISLEKTFFFL